jgi:hypothetical protein
MYTITTMECTGPTNMNHIPIPPPPEPVATDFYRHPYGGIARDIFVTREGFMRFFELEELAIVIAESWAGQGKVFDSLTDDHEYFGYINLFPGGRLSYTITIIDRGVGPRSRRIYIDWMNKVVGKCN